MNVSCLSQENVGRWTAEEQQRFVEGLQTYGKAWKRIAQLIKTRSVVQVRTHAQKYFLKLYKSKQITGSVSIANKPPNSQKGGADQKV